MRAKAVPSSTTGLNLLIGEEAKETALADRQRYKVLALHPR